MEPIAVHVRGNGEWALVHRCAGCAAVRLNRVAGDDNPLMLMRLAVRPLAQPPFPLEWLSRL
jgi:RNHCP domain